MAKHNNTSPKKSTQKKNTLANADYAKQNLASCAPCSRCPQKCACADCPLRVLIVGGIERMESRYRELVEGRGHIFEYHAGHQRKGGNKLDNCLMRADVVLCPVNCNSHTACLQVKRLCKKYGKHVHMMRNFSLSALDTTMNSLLLPTTETLSHH